MSRPRLTLTSSARPLSSRYRIEHFHGRIYGAGFSVVPLGLVLSSDQDRLAGLRSVRFRARARERRGGGDAADERLSGKVWPGSRPGLWVKLLALALIGQVVPFLLLGQAATLTTSADMALMMGAQPIFVFLFGRFLGSRERWTWLAALGLAIGFAGVGVAFWSPGAEAGAHSVLGRAFALAAGVFYGTGAIISGAATREIGAVRAVTASMTISMLVLALLGLALGRLADPAALAASPAASILAMLALGVFNTALAYYVYFRLVHDAGPTFASLNNYVVPLIGVVGGAVALAEPIAPSAWAGLALVLGGRRPHRPLARKRQRLSGSTGEDSRQRQLRRRRVPPQPPARRLVVVGWKHHRSGADETSAGGDEAEVEQENRR